MVLPKPFPGYREDIQNMLEAVGGGGRRGGFQATGGLSSERCALPRHFGLTILFRSTQAEVPLSNVTAGGARW